MNKIFTKLALAAIAGTTIVIEATALGSNADFHDIYRRNCEPTPRAANLHAKISAAENDAIRLAARLAALQRPTITAYSNVKAPEPSPAPTPSETAPAKIITITDSTVVINN